jgi:hypothetical protein
MAEFGTPSEREAGDDGARRHGSAANLGRPFLDLLPITGIAISVFDQDDQQSTIYASDATAARLDDIQFDLGEGPLYRALYTVHPVLIPDLSVMDLADWPIFTAAAVETGAAAMFVFPLTMGAVCIGVAGLYSDATGDLSHDAVATGQALARSIAGPALRRAVEFADDDSPSPPTGRGIELRRDVHQATGIVLAQLNVSATEAFSRMRAHAYSYDRTVQDVANDVILRRLDFSKLTD